MPKCRGCGNTKKFSYRETSYNEAEYNDEGELQDVFHNEYYLVFDGKCLECGSGAIDGQL